VDVVAALALAPRRGTDTARLFVRAYVDPGPASGECVRAESGPLFSILSPPSGVC
jgi:hypothetical protein